MYNAHTKLQGKVIGKKCIFYPTSNPQNRSWAKLKFSISSYEINSILRELKLN